MYVCKKTCQGDFDKVCWYILDSDQEHKTPRLIDLESQSPTRLHHFLEADIQDLPYTCNNLHIVNYTNYSNIFGLIINKKKQMFWGVYRKQEGERTWSDGDDVIVFIVANKTRNPCIEIVLAWSYSIYVKEPFFICSCPKLIILQELNYTYIELYIILIIIIFH